MPTRTPTADTPPAPRKTAAPKPGANPTGPLDAVDFLMKDHREAEGVFEQFEKATSDSRKKEFADKVCMALKVHMQIEEEIFYPEARAAGVDDDKLDEGIVEHDAAKKLIAEIEAMAPGDEFYDAAKKLIAEIEAMAPGDEFYDAKVKVLSEEITHHVEEEEEADGLFAQARKNEDLDLNEMAGRLKARSDELMGDMQ